MGGEVGAEVDGAQGDILVSADGAQGDGEADVSGVVGDGGDDVTGVADVSLLVVEVEHVCAGKLKRLTVVGAGRLYIWRGAAGSAQSPSPAE